MRMPGRTFAVLLIVLVGNYAAAEVTLPAVFSDHMVVQRNKPLPVWGWAAPGEKVKVSIADQSASCKTAADGRWQVTLKPLQAGGPHILTVAGKNSLAVNDVLVGEVWLCSGQSNMAMSVSRAMDYENEQAVADLPQIRHFKTASHATAEPQDRCQGQWTVCSSDTVGAFSATAYFFGREIHKQLDVPVGLINSSWGGTAVEAWTSWTAQKDLEQLEPLPKQWAEQIASYDPEEAKTRHEQNLKTWNDRAAKAKTAGRKPPRRPATPADPRNNQNRPANLFNGMINPLIPYTIAGAIWYQGERNSRGDLSRHYGLQLSALIKDWRTRWGYDLAFAWVQLPNFTAPQTEPVESTGWVLVREGMLKTLAVPNTGMAITTDVGDAGNIHPKNKQAVGRRLAQWALVDVYRKPGVPSGPLYKSMAAKKNAITISFDHVVDGLVAKGGKLTGFTIAGTDREFVWADARIVGDTVVVSGPTVQNPIAVRYAWAPNPKCNLYNKAGLPASPFRTDNWPIELDASPR